jgi:hypothetical protein
VTRQGDKSLIQVFGLLLSLRFLRSLRLWREKEKRKTRKVRQADACFKQVAVFFFFVLRSWWFYDNLLNHSG